MLVQHPAGVRVPSVAGARFGNVWRRGRLHPRSCAVLQSHLKQCMANQAPPPGYGCSSTTTVLFRIAVAKLPHRVAAMPWVQHQWALPAADVTAIEARAKHLFRKR